MLEALKSQRQNLEELQRQNLEKLENHTVPALEEALRAANTKNASQPESSSCGALPCCVCSVTCRPVVLLHPGQFTPLHTGNLFFTPGCFPLPTQFFAAGFPFLHCGMFCVVKEPWLPL